MENNNITSHFKYNYRAFFYVDKFCKEEIEQASNNASDGFNELDRKLFKSIVVKVDEEERCLDITFISEIDIERRNWLRAIQYYCKLLAKEDGMYQYLFGKRLLASL
ncbi:hypothetical protein LL037_21285 [Clostridium estertheticum]|uniref:hypothetical protein n=1 Tax=Clostridium estertheticum TaxID=238834 RepID=UPI001C0B8FF5|nr:hypothetical protein [Clostridium estertheticum]MBU3198277.1 hypothetical protein [Clostridium estertheticum]MCB2354415.1 hypothetical protein [Clostridium estertheticum]WAG42469.1 hypothetical protein LL065_07275 [Clostridium estertheticum]WAG64966.1 hypothetical protein LL037_21285 [Clostridium estertheticum]